MSKVTITVDDAQVQAMFRRLADAAGDLEPALRDIGEYELRATRERASREQSPDGVPWVALSPRYAARKAKKRGGLPMLSSCLRQHKSSRALRSAGVMYSSKKLQVLTSTDSAKNAASSAKPKRIPESSSVPTTRKRMVARHRLMKLQCMRQGYHRGSRHYAEMSKSCQRFQANHRPKPIQIANMSTMPTDPNASSAGEKSVPSRTSRLFMIRGYHHA